MICLPRGTKRSFDKSAACKKDKTKIKDSQTLQIVTHPVHSLMSCLKITLKYRYRI